VRIRRLQRSLLIGVDNVVRWREYGGERLRIAVSQGTKRREDKSVRSGLGHDGKGTALMSAANRRGRPT
jgi:hypothetical protein